MFSKLFKPFKTKSQKVEKENLKTIYTDSDGWYIPLSSENLLNTPLRNKYLVDIWKNVSMTPDMFERLYKKPIHKYAELVQLLPASESHHHSHLGGMLDHGLEVIAIATKLRQNYILPQNSAPEDQAKQRDVWTAAIIYSAILHDLGKIVTDIEFILKNEEKWYPWNEIQNQPYKFRYIKNRDYELHPKLGSFLASYIIPTEALSWIANYPNVFQTFMYFISDHKNKAGILSEIIQKADQLSVTMALGGDINKLEDKPRISFATQLEIALKHVIQNSKLNSPKGGCDGWLVDDGLFVMSKSTADSIRAYLISQGISVPSQNGKLFDELQAHKLIETTPENTAIWTCKVISNIGWAPPKPFTLLKISPNTIWDLDSRPTLFEGKIIPVDNIGNSIETLSTENNNQLSIKSVETIFTETETIQTNTTTTEEQSSENVFDDVLKLFPIAQESEAATEVEGIETNTQKTETDIKKIETATNIKETATIDIKEVKDSTDIQKSESIIKTLKADKMIPKNELRNLETKITADNFVIWLKKGIINGTLVINKPKAKIHIVEKHLFLVTPSIFKAFVEETTGNSNKEEWELLQKDFQNLNLHKRLHTDDGDSRNIWTCEVVGRKNKSLLNGYLIENIEFFIGKKPPYNNHWLQLQGNLE